MSEDRFYVYILAARKDGPIYIGVTNNLARRIFEHKARLVRGFTERYNINQLVYVEAYPTASEAIAREKALKRWRRAWKVHLIEKSNPDWSDLALDGF
jgi:putative endonuclease